MDMNHYGQEMYQLAKRLFPICRSITGNGVRETLDILSEIVPIRKYEVPTGTAVFDWTVPQEWNIRGGFIEDETSKRILDFAWNNLSIVGYSEPVDQVISKEELLEHVYSEPAQPDAIPYVTSYYKRRYGFCMTENQRKTLGKGPFHAVIDSELKDGSLTYGEIVLPGESEQEIFLSTYICHPSMANNELSGPCVLIYLAKILSELPHRRYTYRMIFIPETIGAITYLSRNYIHLKEHVVAGFNISCVGDDRAYSYVASRYGDTLADKAAKNILSFHAPDYKSYGFLQRGSDERQYCAPGIDLPLCAICRSKYGEYPEYHTSLDNLSLISETGLGGALDVYWKCLMGLEHNYYYCVTCLCEPQLGKRGLYPTLSRKGSYHDVQAMTNFIAYADGSNDLFDISNMIRVPTERLIKIADTLQTAGLLERGQNKKKSYKAERKDNNGIFN